MRSVCSFLAILVTALSAVFGVSSAYAGPLSVADSNHSVIGEFESNVCYVTSTWGVVFNGSPVLDGFNAVSCAVGQYGGTLGVCALDFSGAVACSGISAPSWVFSKIVSGRVLMFVRIDGSFVYQDQWGNSSSYGISGVHSFRLDGNGDGGQFRGPWCFVGNDGFGYCFSAPSKKWCYSGGWYYCDNDYTVTSSFNDVVDAVCSRGGSSSYADASGNWLHTCGFLRSDGTVSTYFSETPFSFANPPYVSLVGMPNYGPDGLCALTVSGHPDCHGWPSWVMGNAPSFPIRNLEITSDYAYAVKVSDNTLWKWNVSGLSQVGTVSVAGSSSSGGATSDPSLYCFDNPAGSGSVSFRSVIATGTGYSYDLSLSTVDESWTYPSVRSLVLKWVDINGHSNGSSLAAWGTGRFVVEKGSFYSLFGDPYVEVRSLSGSVNFYRAFLTGSTAYQYQTVYVEDGEDNASAYKEVVDVSSSELRTVGGFSFVNPKPVAWYHAVGFRVVLQSGDKYDFSEFRLGTYSLSVSSCTPSDSGASPDWGSGQSTGSGSSSSSGSSIPSSAAKAPVPSYPSVDQSCKPKLFSGSLVSVSTAANLDPATCAWRTANGAFRCQDSGGHACVVDSDSCLPEIEDPGQYSSGSTQYSGDVTRYECSVGQVKCLWYSKKSCGPSASCYQDGAYCRVKPGEENLDYSSAIGDVTISGSVSPDSSYDFSNLGAIGTGSTSVSGVSHGVGSFSGVNLLPSENGSGFCDMFNPDGSFAYYSDGEPFAITLSASGVVPIDWVNQHVVPHVDRFFNAVTAPINNLGSLLRTFWTFPEGSKVCVLGSVATVRYQSSLKSLDDAKHVSGFKYGSMGFFDYLFIFVFGLIAVFMFKKVVTNRL